MVFQNVYLFHDTIRANICFGKPDATEAEMIEAAKKACCHDFIMELPDGYDTVIGEGGDTLSGGQKQRISIARAMLKDAPIIILVRHGKYRSGKRASDPECGDGADKRKDDHYDRTPACHDRAGRSDPGCG